MKAGRFRKRRGLYLGTDREGRPLYLGERWCRKGISVLGATESGKTRLLLNFFQQFALSPAECVIVVSPKGEFARMARDWAIAHGLTKRLVWFDLGETEHILGYSPLRRNGLAAATHAKAVRERIRAGWGQSSFEQTAQLARLLFLVLYAVRLCGLTLIEAVELLYPKSRTRTAILERVDDPFLREALEYFASLRDTRQDELAASSLARLESFVLDPTIRRVFTQQERALDLGEVIRERKILIVNIENYRPLSPDDVKLLGKFIVNDVIAHTFARGAKECSPVRLIIDEAHDFASEDLARGLDQGRELGLTMVLAHQTLNQLLLEGGERLLHAVRINATTKIRFGATPSVADLRLEQEDLFLDQVDPLAVKDEIMALELDPIEETREIITDTDTWGETESEGWNETEGTSESEGESEGRTLSRGATQTRGRGRSRGRSETSGENESSTDTDGLSLSHDRGRSTTRSLSHQVAYPELMTLSSAEFSSEGRTRNSSSSSGHGTSELFLPSDSGLLALPLPGGETVSTTAVVASGDGSVVASGTVHGMAQTTGLIRSYGEANAATESQRNGLTKTSSRALTRGTNRAHGTSEEESENESTGITVTSGESREVTRTRGNTHAHGTSGGRALQKGGARSVQISPWHSYQKTRRVSSRTFWTKDEQLDEFIRKMMALPKGHYVLKVPGYKAVFVRSPYIKTPRASERKIERALDRVFSLPFYQRPDEIVAEEAARREQLFLEAKPVRQIAVKRRATRRPVPDRDF